VPWGCSKPPLLHRKSDTPGSTLTFSNSPNQKLFADPLTEVLRHGARALLEQALEAEVRAMRPTTTTVGVEVVSARFRYLVLQNSRPNIQPRRTCRRRKRQFGGTANKRLPAILWGKCTAAHCSRKAPLGDPGCPASQNRTHRPCLEASTLPMEKRPGIALVS
jgi:hypothetical protein